MAETRSPRQPLSRIVIYGSVGLPLAALTLPLYIFVPTLYSQVVGLNLTQIGVVLVIVRLCDAVTDPLCGFLSDRTPERFGRRKLWLLLGSPLVVVALAMLFRPPENADIGYLLEWSLVLAVMTGAITIPYHAWGAELSGDYHERARITGVREVWIILGTLVAASLPAVLTQYGITSVSDHAAAVAIFLGVSLPIGVLLATAFVPEPPPLSATRVTFVNGLKAIARNLPFRRILPAHFLSSLANALPASLFILFVTHRLEAPDAYGLLLFVYFLAGLLSVPFWLWLSSRIGKHRAWSVAMLWTCCFFAIVPLFVGPGDLHLFLLIVVMTGIGVGADLSLPAAIYADVVDVDTLDSGEQRTGFFFAMWTFTTKIALALSAGIAFPLLDLAGFNAQAEPGENSESATLVLALLYAGLPVALKLIGTALMWGFPISALHQAETRAKIEARSAAAKGAS